MKRVTLIVLISLLFACKKERFQKIDAKTIAEKEFQRLNLKEVDQFPLFKACDETEDRQNQKACFEQNLHQWLESHINKLEYKITAADTMQLYLSVSSNGKIYLDSVNTKLSIKSQLDSIFLQSPKIYPAQKRGIPITVSFTLPVILKVKPYNYKNSS